MTSFPMHEDLAALVKIAATTTPDDRDIERAFAEQAFTTFSNKAGILMTDPYWLGFEIVNKNDDNTRILGIGGARLGSESKDQLIYFPVVYNNGKLTATDLMYRVGPKKFVPATPDWAQYLVDRSTSSSGQGQDRSVTGKYPVLFMSDRFMRTPLAFGKVASTEAQERKAAMRVMVDDMLQQVKAGGVLRDFILNTAGQSAVDAIVKAAEKSEKFARAVALHLPVDTWMPPELPDKKPVKQASTDAPLLRCFVHEQADAECIRKEASNPEQVIQDLISHGYAMDANENTEPPDHATVVYAGGAPEVRSPTGPGVVDLVLAGGERVKVVLGDQLDWHQLRDSGDSYPCAPPQPLCGHSYDEARPRPMRAVRLDSTGNSDDLGNYWTGTRSVYSEPQDSGNLEEVGIPVTDVQSGELYCFVCPSQGYITEPGYITRKQDQGGVTLLSIAGSPQGRGYNQIILNPDVMEARQNNVLASGKWRAVRVPYTTASDDDTDLCVPSSTDDAGPRAPNWRLADMAPATAADIRASLMTLPQVKEATLSTNGATYGLSINGRSIINATRRSMHAKLASQLLIPHKTAAEMLDQVADSEEGEMRYLLQLPQKHASAMLQLMDQPQFDQSIDPVQQVPLVYNQMAILRTQRTPIFVPPARIGDKLDSVKGVKNAPDSSMEAQTSVPDHILLQSSPDQIAQYAEVNKLPHVFDHAIMSSMAKTYDTQSHLDNYLPKLEDGIDSIGRCIFLLAWKPEDWQKMYGLDDLQEMQDQMTAAFRGSGDLLLALLKKSRSSATQVTTAST
jgi:hypothetical protein